MNEPEFMEQRAEDMSVSELASAIKIKQQQNMSVSPNKELTFGEEIQKYPERFERLTHRGWEIVEPEDGVSKEGVSIILNGEWNMSLLDGNLMYVKFKEYKEIIRRIKND